MTHYMRDGNRYAVAPAGALDITEHLPTATYKVGFNELTTTYFLERIDSFEVSGKIYGNTITQRDRIMRTFTDRSATTGVMLTGEKGSGKTLLAKMLSLEAQKNDVATLVINEAWCGDAFNAFMQSIAQPVVVIFDEFEKVYDADDQQRLLTLLDGTYTSKKLFVLTANDRYRVDDHMKNRPGRIFYRIDFTGVDVDFVRAYCADNLLAKDRIEDVAKASRLFSRFNFDILKALVEEMNRFDEGVEEALEMLNAKPERGEKLHYLVSAVVGGEVLPKEKMHTTEWRGNPLTDSFTVYYRAEAKVTKKLEDDITALFDEMEEEVIGVELDPSALKRVDIETGEFLFESENGVQVALIEKLETGRIDYRVVS